MLCVLDAANKLRIQLREMIDERTCFELLLQPAVKCMKRAVRVVGLINTSLQRGDRGPGNGLKPL